MRNDALGPGRRFPAAPPAACRRAGRTRPAGCTGARSTLHGHIGDGGLGELPAFVVQQRIVAAGDAKPGRPRTPHRFVVLCDRGTGPGRVHLVPAASPTRGGAGRRQSEPGAAPDWTSTLPAPWPAAAGLRRWLVHRPAPAGTSSSRGARPRGHSAKPKVVRRVRQPLQVAFEELEAYRAGCPQEGLQAGGRAASGAERMRALVWHSAHSCSGLRVPDNAAAHPIFSRPAANAVEQQRADGDIELRPPARARKANRRRCRSAAAETRSAQ
jgi:hypothetical protein